jgi:hypothetical protein
MAFSGDEKQKIVEAVRTYMARERISRDEFAQRTKLGKSTIDKLVTGLFSERTILQIEARLNIRLRDTGRRANAPVEFGGYTQDEGSYFLGKYIFIRPSFREDGVIVAFHMEIVWGTNPNVLELREGERDDGVTPQVGTIHMPRALSHLFILCNEGGLLQTIIVSQLNALKRMRGVMLAAANVLGNMYLPVAAPVVFIKVDKVKPDMTGRITSGSPMFDTYNAELASVVVDSFGRSMGL